LVEIGRGSPTGVIVYRHRAWPKRYRDGVFAACWSMGKIYHCPLTPHRSSYKSTLEVFLEGEGATGLAIVGMAIDPAGDMYVAVGGRKTQGSVYRIRFVGQNDEPTAEERKTETEWRSKSSDKLYDVLTADQPLANWSRARWEPAAREAGSAAFLRVCQDASVDFAMRIRAVEVLTEIFEGVPSAETADVKRELHQFVITNARLANTAAHQLRARLIWSAARKWPAAEAFAMAKAELKQPSISQRAAFEALLSLPQSERYTLDCMRNTSDSGDERVRRSFRSAYLLHFDREMLQSCRQPNDPFDDGGWSQIEPTAEQALAAGISGLDSIRHAIKALGDIPDFAAKPELYVGYQSKNARALIRATPLWRNQLYRRYPRWISDQTREYARLLALLEDEQPETLNEVVQSLAVQTAPEDDIHFLIVVSRLRALRTPEITQSIARALVLLHHKLAARDAIPGRNWPLRVGELFEELCKKDPQLADAVIEDEKFGLPEHALFVSKMTGQTQVRAARTLLATVVKSEADWNTDLISALAVLPTEELRPHLKIRFDEPALRDAVALIIAASPVADDRGLLVEALASVQPNVVRAVAEGLARLNDKAKPAEIAEALRALRRQILATNERATREALVALLKNWTGQSVEVTEKKGSDLAAAYRPWFDWFDQAHPGEAKYLAGFAGDLASWQKRLATVDWSGGGEAAGKSVYEKRSCHRCHSGSGRLGPDLAGAATRFSREDLFAAIVDPNREVAPVYQTTEVVTESGQVYNGLVVYESPDTTMLQTGPDTVVRVGGVRKDGMRKSNVSLMPVGLLNDLSDRELADLYAYLKTLAN
jgi:putative heme-binding domain-containing protein